MKKVSGRISCRPLGSYDFEFYVEDNATDKEISEKVDEICEFYMGYDVEPGYVAEQQTVYRKKEVWE